jgi:hypothetical protein
MRAFGLWSVTRTFVQGVIFTAHVAENHEWINNRLVDNSAGNDRAPTLASFFKRRWRYATARADTKNCQSSFIPN